MRFCAGQAGTEFTLFARLCAACGTTNRQRFFLRDFHAYTLHGISPERWSIVTILQSLERSMISIREGAKRRRKFWRNACSDSRGSLNRLFLRSDPCPIDWPRTQTNPQRSQYLKRDRCRNLLTSLTPRNLLRRRTGRTPRSQRCQSLPTSLTKTYSRGSKLVEEKRPL
jgi:hypothetical protein